MKHFLLCKIHNEETWSNNAFKLCNVWGGVEFEKVFRNKAHQVRIQGAKDVEREKLFNDSSF